MEKDKIVGYSSLLFATLILISFVLMVLEIIPPAGNPVTALLMFFGFIYTFYRTVIKKQRLSKSEWIAIAILIAIFLLPFFLF